ncbi:MAG: hypothetical protein GY760_28195 [Deltaproteobacteria bacterium]|nr:hypothetical protein [Deltaproteobacteria bacterium]
MISCPNCKKNINLSISGKLTCTCGEIVQIPNIVSNLITVDTKVDRLRNKIKDHGATIYIGFLVLFLTMIFAWNNDLPDFFGPYSDLFWKIVSSFLLFLASFFFFISVSGFYTDIKNKEMTTKRFIELTFNTLISVVFIIIFLNDLGLTDMNIWILAS